MINIEDLTDLIPKTAGRIVGITTYRGEFVIVACEYGMFRLWDDGFGTKVSRGPESDREKITV